MRYYEKEEFDNLDKFVSEDSHDSHHENNHIELYDENSPSVYEETPLNLANDLYKNKKEDMLTNFIY